MLSALVVSLETQCNVHPASAVGSSVEGWVNMMFTETIS